MNTENNDLSAAVVACHYLTCRNAPCIHCGPLCIGWAHADDLTVANLTVTDFGHVTSTTPSTSPTTGAFVVDGGMGVGGDIYAGGGTYVTGPGSFWGKLHIYDTTHATSTDASAIFEGGVTVHDNVLVLGTEQSTDKDTGCLVLEGGLGVEKNVNVGGNLGVVGTAHVANATTSTTWADGALYVDGGVGIGDNLHVRNGIGADSVASNSLTLGNPFTTTTVDLVDNDINLSANSDSRLVTQRAIRAYVAGAVSGLTWKFAVRLATAADLAGAIYAGTPAFTLTAPANALLHVDGQTTLATQRILVMSQADQRQNGIYVVTDAGADDPGGRPWILTRATDYNDNSEIGPGNAVYVEWGNTMGGIHYVMNNYTFANIDVDPVTWTDFNTSLTNVLLFQGDLLTRDNTDVIRLGVGSAGQVLTVDLTTPTYLRWAYPAGVSLLTTVGDLLTVDLGGSLAVLGHGTVGQALLSNLDGTISWQTPCTSLLLAQGDLLTHNGLARVVQGVGASTSGMALVRSPGPPGTTGIAWNYVPPDVATVINDLVYATGPHAYSRIPIGSPNQVLTVPSPVGAPAWRNSTSVCTVIGDIPYCSVGVVPGPVAYAPLAAGAAGYVLTANGAGAVPSWQLSAGTSLLAAQGDLLTHTGLAIAVQSVGATAGMSLVVSPGLPGTNGIAWAHACTSRLTASGQIVYHNGTGIVALSPGSAGQALVLAGAPPLPAWENSPDVATAVGDIVYCSSVGPPLSYAPLPIGSPYQSLCTNAGATAPEWAGCARYALATTGDIPYASASHVVSPLAAVAAGKVLCSEGATTAPAYDYCPLDPGSTYQLIATSGVAHTYAGVTNGSTGQVLVATAGAVPAFAWQFGAKGQLLVGAGATQAPSQLAYTNTANYVLQADTVNGTPKWALDPTMDLVAAKGDLLVGTAANALVALTYTNTSGFVLQADTVNGTPKWAYGPTDVAVAGGDLVYASGSHSYSALTVTANDYYSLCTNTGHTAPTWLKGCNAALTTVGDMLYCSVSGTPATLAKLGIGGGGQVLATAGTVPAWTSSASTSGYILVSQGTGAVPQWVAPGTVVGGVLSGTQWGATYWATATTLGATVAGTAGQILKGTGSSAPNWQAAPGTAGHVLTCSNAAPVTLAWAYGPTDVAVAGGDLVYASGPHSYSALTVTANDYYSLCTNTGHTAPTWLKGCNAALTTVGDMLYCSVSGTPATLAKLGIGGGGQVLATAGTVPAWTSSTSTSGYILVSQGTGAVPQWVAPGTVVSSGLSGTQWGATYWATATTLGATVAGTAGQLLKGTGSSAPNWQAAPGTVGHVLTCSNAAPVTLTWQYGPTDVAVTKGDLITASGAHAYQAITALAKGRILISQGTTETPVWSDVGTVGQVLVSAGTGQDMVWRLLTNVGTASGDLIYCTAAASGTTPATYSPLARGAAYQSLCMNSGAALPEWANGARATLTTAGDMLYCSVTANHVLSRLGIAATGGQVLATAGSVPAWTSSTSTAGYVLTSQGNAAVPQWAAPTAAASLPTYSLSASDFENPNNSDWAQSTLLAPAIADPTYNAMTVRNFAYSASLPVGGAGFSLAVPAGVTSMTLQFTGRYHSAPGASNLKWGVKAYVRTILNQAPAWSAPATRDVVLANNTAFYQTATALTDTVANWGVAASGVYQIELVRFAPSGNASAQHFYLLRLVISFA